MILLLATLLLTQTAPAADTVVAGPVPPGTFADDGARAMLTAARARRESTESTILRYRNLATSRISVGISTLRRERLLYRCESAVRVDWQRDEPIRMEVLGAREVIPIVSARARPEKSECSGAIFDPTEDRLSLGTSGFLRADSGYARHPLSVGSEADYRFRSGDVTTLRLPEGRVIRLRELQVIPRRSDSRLVRGSLWLEEESMAVVRAVLQLARPFDLGRDGDEGDEADVPAILRPVRADVRFITVEYGLWEGRWWLPRRSSVEGEMQAGSLMKVPFRMEQGYTEYEVWGDAQALPPPETRLDAPAESCVPRKRRSEPADSAGETGESYHLAVGTGGAEVSVPRPSCICRDGRCWRVERVLGDTAQLLTSVYLPASIFEEGEMLFSEREMTELRDLLRASAPAPWQPSPPQIRWGWQGLDLVRYNRVEGLSVGGRAEIELGRGHVDATARLGVADLIPNLDFGFTTTGVMTERRIGAYQRLNSVRPASRALGLGNSLKAIALGRDDGFYYRSAGGEVLLRPSVGAGISARIFAEHQRAAAKKTDVALPRLWSDHRFPDNIEASQATQVGLDLGWTHNRGLDPTGRRYSVALLAEMAGGDYRYLQPSATVSGSLPLGGGLLGGMEISGGTSLGEIPEQRAWYIGGPATIRGYSSGAEVGTSFWRTRAEVARAAPGARVIVFSDAGRADITRAPALDPTLLSVGVGASFLDGLLRLDLARGLRGNGGWRLDLHFDAPL
jgi:hypothetical protein